MPGLLAPLTTPGNVVFHGVTPGARNMTLMGVPCKTQIESGGLSESNWWLFPSPPAPRCCTRIIVEHPEAVGVVVSEELPRNDVVVLAHQLQVLLIEAVPEPRLVPCLLEEPRGHVANDVHLWGGPRVAQRHLLLLSLSEPVPAGGEG